VVGLLGFLRGLRGEGADVPFHTWLPDAHTEAPTAGSVILASVLLKMGTYGFLRFSVPLLPDAAKDHTIVTVMAVLSIIGIVYGALACLMQKDWKKLVAYSSVSHLGFCTLGIFALNPAGISGLHHSADQPRHLHRHALSDRGRRLRAPPHARDLGVWRAGESDAGIHRGLGLAALSSMGMPPLNGFIGEITILGGVYQVSLNWAFWTVVGIALGAAYLLWLFQRTMLGEVKEKNQGLKDLSWREIAVFAPLLVWPSGSALNPQPYFACWTARWRRLWSACIPDITPSAICRTRW